jgi:5,10-methylenetetrahydromethanopterin reductase
MKLSAAFVTTLQTPEHVRLAEDLGYSRAWLYDTPQQSPDVWMTLALAARVTSSIGLGPGVLVPTLRHPMVNAAATAALAQLAPGRVAVGFGTGFTGRRAMGQRKPIPWAYMADYIRVFKALLRGKAAEWEGGLLRMLHDHTAAAADRPVEVPVYIGALGPKGLQVARTFATACSSPAASRRA